MRLIMKDGAMETNGHLFRTKEQWYIINATSVTLNDLIKYSL